jgi:hypothetical protein
MHQELRYYLESLKILIPQLNLEKPLYKEGTTIGQITFHCAQAANYWIRVIILRQTFLRNRDSEFTDQPTLEQINTSIDFALEACSQLEKANPKVTEKLEKPVNIMPINFKAKTNLDALLHATAHTAEHYGELFQTTR